MRVLVVSHSHPRLSKGGAEIAAYQLYFKLNSTAGVTAWFLGCSTKMSTGRDGVSITQPFSEREYVYEVGSNFDWFSFSNNDPRLPDEFAEIVSEVKPDIIHFHHYVNIGIELFLIIKRRFPSIVVLLTLHEYLAICNHYGQMVKRPTLRLCDADGPLECVECFEKLSPSDFFLRKNHIQGFFKYVDYFICPSQFLLERYRRWGVGSENSSVIENLVRSRHNGTSASAAASDNRKQLVIGFFGQISKLKGIEVLIECANQLFLDGQTKIRFEIHGDYSNQPEEFRKDFLSTISHLGSNVKYKGAYNEINVDDLMRKVDLIVVPSIWWENSPVVIQEAFRNGIPVVCSDLGGMAEKVRDGVDGFRFPSGDSSALAELLLRLENDRALVLSVAATMQKPVPEDDVVKMHLDLYHRLQFQGKIKVF